MTRTCAILTLAVGLALTGCASSDTGSAWNQSSTPDTTGSANAANNGANVPNNGQMNNDTGTVAAGAAAPDNPQVSPNPKVTMGTGLSAADRDFINNAMGSGLYEVNSSEKALLKSNDDHVKQIAQHMIDDHTKANRELQNLSNRKNNRETAGMTSDEDAMLSKLDKLNGGDFDHEYLSQQKQAHQDAISLFENASANANDKDIRDFASTTLPVLREHLAMINNQINPENTPANNNVGSER